MKMKKKLCSLLALLCILSLTAIETEVTFHAKKGGKIG